MATDRVDDGLHLFFIIEVNKSFDEEAGTDHLAVAGNGCSLGRFTEAEDVERRVAVLQALPCSAPLLEICNRLVDLPGVCDRGDLHGNPTILVVVRGINGREVNPDLIIADSIQSFVLEEFLPSRAGSPTQTMECANELLKIAKNNVSPKAVIVIGQMTKNDELAGLRALEHLVDTVLIIDGENEEELRGLLASKNRFGSTGEMGFFSMTEIGLLSIDNPSEFFMTKRASGEVVSGSALTVIKEGSRPIIVEIESLVSNSFTPFPSRIGEGLGKDQLNTLISVLEQRGKINLFNKNVVIKTTGGLRLREHAINLCVIMSIASSVFDKGIPNDVAFVADIGLTGELKKVPSLETRIKELDRMGFRKVYVAQNAFNRPIKFNKIEVVESKTLQEVIHSIFGKVEKNKFSENKKDY